MVDDANTWKTVWITGASSGIGYELAQKVAAETDFVAISARSEAKLSKLASSLPQVHTFGLDVTDETACRQCVEQIEQRSGPIDLAVLNAGLWELMEATHFDLAKAKQALDVNYAGVLNCLDAILPSMLQRGSGHIAIVASVAGYRGLPRSIAYGPTKAALINLAEILNCELAGKGITVSVVNPGFVDTPMTRENPFPMPGIIPAERAAQELLQGLRHRTYEIVFPRGFVWAMKLLRLLPNALYFALVRNIMMRNLA